MNFIIEAIAVVIILYSVITIIWRIISNSGINLKNKAIIENENPYLPDRNECIKVFGYAISFRIIILILSIAIYYIFINNGNTFSFQEVISNWKKWDANHYINISKGYEFYIEDGAYKNLVFFPLYSWLIGIVNFIINNAEVSGIIISSICYSIACVYIYKLVSLDYGKEIAKKTLILISICPFGFFFGGIMSESTFLLFSAMTLYYIRKHKWIVCGITGFLAALTRNLGVFLIIPACIELIEETQVMKRIKEPKYIVSIFVKEFLPLLLIPIGFLIYLCINYHITGDWFYFIKIDKENWQQEYNPFYITVANIVNYIKDYDLNKAFTIFIPELIVTVFMYALLCKDVRKNRTMYSAWLLICIIINTSISWPLSIGRYMICAIPAFIILAKICEKKSKFYMPIVVFFTITFTIFYVGYLSGKLIM